MQNETTGRRTKHENRIGIRAQHIHSPKWGFEEEQRPRREAQHIYRGKGKKRAKEERKVKMQVKMQVVKTTSKRLKTLQQRPLALGIQRAVRNCLFAQPGAAPLVEPIKFWTKLRKALL